MALVPYCVGLLTACRYKVAAARVYSLALSEQPCSGRAARIMVSCVVEFRTSVCFHGYTVDLLHT